MFSFSAVALLSAQNVPDRALAIIVAGLWPPRKRDLPGFPHGSSISLIGEACLRCDGATPSFRTGAAPSTHSTFGE
jgi:hypothetical protein